MRVISLWNPYATLMVGGAKRIETRTWPPNNLKAGEVIAIHAAKHWTRADKTLILSEPFRSVLATLAERGVWDGEQLPLGCIVGYATFMRAVSTGGDPSVPADLIAPRDFYERMSEQEYAFGNYAPGRYAWQFTNARAFVEPIPFSGQKYIFEWKPPVALREIPTVPTVNVTGVKPVYSGARSVGLTVTVDAEALGIHLPASAAPHTPNPAGVVTSARTMGATSTTKGGHQHDLVEGLGGYRYCRKRGCKFVEKTA